MLNYAVTSTVDVVHIRYDSVAIQSSGLQVLDWIWTIELRFSPCTDVPSKALLCSNVLLHQSDSQLHQLDRVHLLMHEYSLPVAQSLESYAQPWQTG